MPTLLGKAGIVDDPGHDRTVPLDLWQYHLAHLGQHLLVRPLSRADKMQQRLMLGGRAIRRRDRRHRLNALALARHQQAGAIMPQRFLAVLVVNGYQDSGPISAITVSTAVRPPSPGTSF